MSSSIAFIGGGNMASSLVGGLIASGTAADSITVAEPDATARQALAERFGINAVADNQLALGSDTVILAVKPQVMQQVCRELSVDSDHSPLFVSIAAGIPCAAIEHWLGGNVALIRCMPNTPALLQCGATAMYANAQTSEARKQSAAAILDTVGMTLWVDDENLLDAVTAVSGSGPAYFFLLIEAMQQAGTELGLDSSSSSRLAIQTALGAARMAAENDISPAELRARVTSKGGTTAAAIASFEQDGFQAIVSRALKAAADRSAELARELGSDN